MSKRKDPKASKAKTPAKRETSIPTVGRPTKFTEELMEEILIRIAQGESLNAICKGESMPAESTVRAWVLDDVGGISAKYARARELQAEFWADDILRLADESREGIKTKETAQGVEVTTGDMVERTRLQIEARKWLLSKLLPKKYGDKLDMDHNIQGEINVKITG